MDENHNFKYRIDHYIEFIIYRYGVYLNWVQLVELTGRNFFKIIKKLFC